MDKPKKRIGRPTRPPKPGERVTLGLRVTAELKNRIEAAANEKGRSLSQEAEFRLERSFDREDISKAVAKEVSKEVSARFDRAEGLWRSLREKVRREWAKMTEDDLAKFEEGWRWVKITDDNLGELKASIPAKGSRPRTQKDKSRAR
jgi:hypothetical protein